MRLRVVVVGWMILIIDEIACNHILDYQFPRPDSESCSAVVHTCKGDSEWTPKIEPS